METSAKNSSHIEDVFNTMAAEIIPHMPAEDSTSTSINVSSDEEKKNKPSRLC